MNMDLENKELINVFQLFFDELPCLYEIKNTSRGETDFRETVIAEWSSGEKYVIKLSDNDFTFPDKIQIWKRCAEEYQKLGYYCPMIFPSKLGDFPRVTYKDRSCVVYVEEFCKYTVAEERFKEDAKEKISFDIKWADAAWMMTAKVAAKRFDFAIIRQHIVFLKLSVRVMKRTRFWKMQLIGRNMQIACPKNFKNR